MPRRFLALTGVKRWAGGLLAAVLILFGLLAGPCVAAEEKHVFILHSYHPGLRWTDGIMAGMQEVFSGAGETIQMHVDYLDAKRYPSPEYIEKFVETILPYKLENLSFDLVMVSDNAAFNFVLQHRKDLFAGIPLVFCGVNGFDPSWIAGLGDVTGIAEEPAVAETLHLALRLHPGTQEVVVIGETDSVTGRRIDVQVRAAVQEVGEGVRFAFWNDVPLEELTRRGAELRPGQLVLLSSVIRGRDGHFLSYVETARRLRQAFPVPLFGLWDFFLGEGIVGGRLISAQHQGRLAARFGLSILRGERAEQIPVIRSEANSYMFDYRELQRFGIDPDSLPEKSVVIHRPSAFYSVSREGLWTALAIFAALLAILVLLIVIILQRRRSEEALRQSEERFRSIFKTAAAGMVLLSPEGRFLEVNPALCAFLGYEEEELLGLTVEQITHPGEREATRRGYGEIMTGRRRNLEYQKRYVRKDGEVVWGHASVACVVSPAMKPLFCVALVQNITESKRSEEALRESEERFRTLVDQAADAFLLHDFTGQILDVNQQSCRLLGYSHEELVRMNISELEQDFSPERASRILNGLVPGVPDSFEGTGRRKDGTTFPLEGRICLIDSWGETLASVLVRDVTERREWENRLREALVEAEDAREKVAAVLRSVADGLIFTDTERRVVLMNRAAEELLGVEMNWVRGRPVDTILPDGALSEHIVKVLCGEKEWEPVVMEMTDRKRREVRFIQARTSPVHEAEGVKNGVITLLRDITREREIDRMKSEFISVAAHELRTPLTSVLGYAGLLLTEEEQGGFNPAQRREFLSYIQNKAQELKGIIDDLLNLSRIESGRVLLLDRMPCDMTALIGEVVPHHRQEAPRHRIEIEGPAEPVVVLADRGKVLQLLDNILGNAVKYSPGGGTIRVELRVVDADLQVSVRDEGIGMSREQTARVFEKFYRADVSDSSICGLGLGMTLVKSIVEAHGGRVWVKSEPGMGTEVSFTLPLPRGATG